MADVTSGPERPHADARDVLQFGTIVVVGGGCYGGYYVRQLGRAQRAGAAAWRRLVVVDRDPACAVATLAEGERPPALEVVTEEWVPFFERWLGELADGDAAIERADIVPSPLMPHLMAGWLEARARRRWPTRSVGIAALEAAPAVPWQRAGDDGTHYVSFAEWMCPINCIEPVRCPHTRGTRDWSMPVAVSRYAETERAAGRPVDGPFLFRCLHRAYGVGMLDVREILAADRAIATRGAQGAASFLIGTVSHCHGALRRLVLSA
jgi:hypothetical protein